MDEATEVHNAKEWDIEIKPKENPFDLHLNDIWNYRDLLFLFVKRDFISFYKQTIFGPLWFFIQPIFTTVLFTFVFNVMGKFSTEGSPAPLFYLSGIITWNYFSECITKTSTVFRDNYPILSKVYFPRLILPLSIVVSNLVRFGVQFILFLLVFLYYIKKGAIVNPNIYIFLFPLILILLGLTGLGIGLIITAMTTKYRDLVFLVAFGIQLLMYATPVIYPLSVVPDKFKSIIFFNPLSGLIETFRYGFLGNGKFYPGALLYSIIASILLFMVGLFIFNKVEKKFVDTI